MANCFFRCNKYLSHDFIDFSKIFWVFKWTLPTQGSMSHTPESQIEFNTFVVWISVGSIQPDQDLKSASGIKSTDTICSKGSITCEFSVAKYLNDWTELN